MTEKQEPAIKSYFFGKGFSDLKAVFSDGWNRNITSKDFFFREVDGYSKNFFFKSTGVSVIVFGSIMFAVLCTLHAILLGIFFLLIYLAFTVIWLLERSFMLLRGIFIACPNCHERYTLPVYLCDGVGCSNEHHRLMPNQYGILYHKCNCSQKLPATFFVNRGRLKAKCPKCNEFLDRSHVEAKKICIPILGGPSAGKTAYMYSVLRKLIDDQSNPLGISTKFIDKNTANEYKKVVRGLREGTPPDKTTDPIPKAFNLELKRRVTGKKWLLYMYDPSGEAYKSTDSLSKHGYQGYLSGMILVIDPFSLAEVKQHYRKQLAAEPGIRPSELDVDEALDRLIITMEQSFGLSKRAQIKKPLCIIINKIDAFNLEDIIGETAVDREYARSDYSDRSIVRDKIIRKQLKAWGETALLQQIDTRFRYVRYFTCSALGRSPDSSKVDFVPQHVLDPMQWLLKKSNPKDFTDIK